MGNMGYNELMERIFHSVVDVPGVDMCGENASMALRTLSERMGRDDYFDIEDKVSAGFRENAYNGFCSGFRCATLLFLGEQAFTG